jgi:hypothetical protein
MTEAEWLSWDKDPGGLLNVVRDPISDRKLRLFACACARQVLSLLSDGRSKQAVPMGELLADGLISPEQAMAAAAEAGAAVMDAAAAHGAFSTAVNLALAARYTLARPGLLAFAAANRAAGARPTLKKQAQQTQCSLFRDIVCNPFRQLVVQQAWRAWNNSTVAKLAQTIYDERAFDRLLILADALEEAGCTNAFILDHCRQPGEHVRGCWVVDLILGKS